MRRGTRWLGLGLLLVAAAAAVLNWPARPPDQPLLAMPALAPAAAEVAAAPASISASAVAQALAVAKPAALASAIGKAPGDSDKEFVEICGVGRLKRSELEMRESEAPPAWAADLDRAAEQARDDVIKRLEAGPLRQRVAAALMRGDTQAAAQLAASGEDAQAYRLALRACRKDAGYRQAYAHQLALPAASAASGFEMPIPGPVPHACAALTLERFEVLEPNDAWPWLVRLNDSATQADQAGIAQALYQFAQRPRSSAQVRALSGILAEVVGPEPTPGETMALMNAVGIDMASLWDGSLSGVLRVCRGAALNDANRRQLCEQAARRAPGMVTEIFDAGQLHRLEEGLGLPHSPQALSRVDADRAVKAMSEESMHTLQPFSCAGLSSMGRQVMMLARQGELNWARAYLKASPASAAR